MFRSIQVLLAATLVITLTISTSKIVYAPDKSMNGTMKMGYAHVSIGEYGKDKTEEITLHLDARYFDKVVLKVDCIGIDTGHVFKEIDLYHLLNITKPKNLTKENLLTNESVSKTDNGDPVTKEKTNE
jgi:hypothetical protein